MRIHKFIMATILLLGSLSFTSAQNVEQMGKDILSLPGMNKFSCMFVSEPSADEPYYTFKVGDDTEDHFATLYWFHVYTKPTYAIKVYDIVNDSEEPAKEFLIKAGYKSTETRPQNQDKWEVEPLQKTTEIGMSSPDKGLFLKYTNADVGITAETKDGSVFLTLNLDNLSKFMDPDMVHQRITQSEYEVKGLKAHCVGIFAADIGQNINPVLCMLLNDGTVQVLPIFDTILNNANFSGFVCTDRLPDFQNIVSFEFGGGGAYENEGEIMFSYVTIYAIDENGKKHEIIVD